MFTTRIRVLGYLLVLWLAESTGMFRPFGKEIDNSIYFTLYRLWTIAHSFKDIPPYRLSIQYDRPVAGKIYNMLSKDGHYQKYRR